jgi:hypothetical protein
MKIASINKGENHCISRFAAVGGRAEEEQAG